MSSDSRVDGFRMTAAEVARNFALAREKAIEKPVFITNHGRESHVLLTHNGFTKLCNGGVSQAVTNPLRDFGEWISDAVVVFDRNLVITYTNRIAQAAFRRTEGELIGRAFDELPGLPDSHLVALVRRTNSANEPATVEMASSFADDSWIRVRSFGWGDRNVLLFHDITERIESQRMLSTKMAILHTMAAHGSIDYVRVSVRGTINRVDKPFAELVGLPEERLKGVPLVNLFQSTDRTLMRDAIDQAIESGATTRLEVGLIANNGSIERLLVGVAQLAGPYGVDGAIVVMTPVSSVSEVSAARIA